MKSLFSKIKPQAVPVAEKPGQSEDAEKRPESSEEAVASSQQANDDTISPEAQPGVQAIEATTSVWTTKWLVAAYLLCVHPSRHCLWVFCPGSY